MKHCAAQDQKVTQDDEEDPESEGDLALQGDLGQRGHLVNMDQWEYKDQSAPKGISVYRVKLVPWGLKVRQV